MTDRVATVIDLNCDLGEGGGHDAALMPFVSSVNVACGGHAGDVETMVRTVRLARQHGLAVGAHPGHRDRDHFGRRELPLPPDAVEDLIVGQIAALADVLGEPPRHVKLHGGLYHQVGRDPELAARFCDAVATRWPAMIVVAAAGSTLAAVVRSAGRPLAAEAFLDRAYLPTGGLVPRSLPGAVITDARAAADRAVRLARAGDVEAIDGSLLPVRPDTLCLHGDGVDPVGFARAVRTALAEAGVGIRPSERA